PAKPRREPADDPAGDVRALDRPPERDAGRPLGQQPLAALRRARLGRLRDHAPAGCEPRLADRVRGGGGGDRGDPGLPRADLDRTPDPGGRRRSRGGVTHRNRRPAPVRHRRGDRLRQRGAGRDRLRQLLLLRSRLRLAAVDLRLRGGGDRRGRVALGDVAGRHHPRRRPGAGRAGGLRLRRPGRPPGLPGRAGSPAQRPAPGPPDMSAGTPAARFRVTRSRRPPTATAVLSAVVVLALASAPYLVYADITSLLVNLFILLVLATTWNLLAGYAGLISVGQQAYVGIGAYTVLVLAQNGV